ncbi:hypothetical protein T458_13655 [Brevibacillus panacihumi W25]|uniref:Uncharacterized protein n=1 Tax=Brevibacillus panacihumi W25 TaxID=1408254 RepID=V6M905_9BACL|nr:hypothetical protein [Brevibacillus panacihumi]EST54365.1 hypothetical protein T458_13655 [Brevibacillus panacihumi W25]
MKNQDEQKDQSTSTENVTSSNSSLDESEIEKRHQFQMFPTPDEKFASKVITELED